MTTIDLVYFDAGGGHRAAALALKSALNAQHPTWTVRLVHLMRALDPQQRFETVTGKMPEDFYNWRLERGWTFGLGAELRVMQAVIRAGHAWLIKSLRAHWASQSRPDLVVSLVPNFNRALRESLQRECPKVPFVTVMTDLADLPPHFWIEPGLDLHIVCGTQRSVEQARAAGYSDAVIHRTSGMIIRPDFYRPAVADRRKERLALNLDPDRPTGLVMFGGYGSSRMVRIAHVLDDQQLIFLCGHNQALAESLRQVERSAPHAALGFSSEVGRLMAAADYFIGKPGPGALSEALHCGLPVVTFRDVSTMPQERFNTEWVEQHQVGAVVSSTRQLPAAVRSVLARIGPLSENVARIRNRAIFEVPDILNRVLSQARANSGSARELHTEASLA
jgi:UDP-N-acetylglucosamine:LPS N-acetylglucosamine transferase